MSFRCNRPKRARGDAGFTLIEVLVALAVATVSLASIGALVSSYIRSARSLDQRMTALETARALLFRLTERGKLGTGSTTGEVAGYSWRLDASPYPTAFAEAMPDAPWRPEGVVLRVRSPGGQIVRVETIRLIPPETAKQ